MPRSPDFVTPPAKGGPTPTPRPKLTTPAPKAASKPSLKSSTPTKDQPTDSLSGMSDADIEAQLRAEPFWPVLAPFWNIPELRQTLLDGQSKRWSATDFEYAIKGTNWYANTPDTARKWLGMAPADQQAAINDSISKVRTAAMQNYWIPMTDSAVTDWATKLASGQIDQGTFDQYLQGQAKALFGNNPTMAAAIDRGATPQTLLSPYLSIASKELEVPADDLVGNTKVFGSIMQGNLPTLSDFTAQVRSLPEWKTTQGANDQAAALEKQMLATFGGPKP